MTTFLEKIQQSSWQISIHDSQNIIIIHDSSNNIDDSLQKHGYSLEGSSAWRAMGYRLTMDDSTWMVNMEEHVFILPQDSLFSIVT